MSDDPKCGFVSIVGRANVGKSTLFNKLLGDQLSVATYKPHTTRHNIR
ncbi:MAG: 50S ribosome-binding GTPase, partial [Gammaproteobacteria bacterium]|nr:50S ribosome-binding GTPase [Gammaproteobacteria bacterium]